LQVWNSSTRNTDEYFSELATDGKVGWSLLSVYQDMVEVSFPSIKWNRKCLFSNSFHYNSIELLQWVNNLAVLEFQGWAISQFSVLEDSIYVLSCK
jgi:hypothetical protein